jgi:hypothetical protein
MDSNIVEFLISDILTASLISAVFLFISNKISDTKSREQEKHLQEMKDHIDQKLHQAVLEIENDIITNIDRVIK